MQGFVLGLSVGLGLGAFGAYYFATENTPPAGSRKSLQSSVGDGPAAVTQPRPSPTPLARTESESLAPATAPAPRVTKVDEVPVRTAGPVAQPLKFTSPSLEGKIPGYPKLEDASRLLIDETRVLADSNKPEEAVKLLERALSDNPSDEYLAIELALAHNEYLKDATRSEAVLRKLVKDKPESRLAATALGDFLTNQGRFAEATESLRQATQGEQALPEAFAKLGHNLSAVRDTKGALESFERAYQGFSAQEQSLARDGESTLFAERKRVAAALDLAFANLNAGKAEAAQLLYSEILRSRGKDDPGVVALGTALNKISGSKNAE